MGGDRLSKFNAASEALLREMVMAAPDAKRDELVAALRDTGLVVSPATVQRALARLGFTRN
jgi:arginine repressor